MDKPTLLIDCKNAHGEGVVWCKITKRVFWTDIEGRNLWIYHPESQKEQSFPMPDRLCAFALRDDGTILAAFDAYIALLDLATNNFETLFEFEPENPFSRLNDGKADKYGNFIVGGVNETDDDAYRTSVIKIDENLQPHTILSGISCANSICFSPDGKTVYFSDTPTKTILAFPYGPHCTELINPRQVYMGEGRLSLPDGSTVDSQGYIWNAVWNGYAVIRIDPQTGMIDKIIDLPVRNPTCVAFGGEKLTTLFITTSRSFMTEKEIEKEPLSGGLFSIELPVGGL